MYVSVHNKIHRVYFLKYDINFFYCFLLFELNISVSNEMKLVIKLISVKIARSTTILLSKHN